jgi:hypothetical protein
MIEGLTMRNLNNWVAVKITNCVSTMWCAYVFAGIAFISLPEALKGGRGATVAWIAQTFLQLVLLSIIMVGQKVQKVAGDEQAECTRSLILETHDAAVSMKQEENSRAAERHEESMAESALLKRLCSGCIHNVEGRE